MEDFISKPISEYKEKFSKEINQKAEETFDRLVGETSTDAEANKKTMSEYYKQSNASKKLAKTVTTMKVFAWIFMVMAVITGVMSYFLQDLMLYLIIGAVVVLAASIILFVFASKQKKSKDEIDKDIVRLKVEAEAQTKALKEAMKWEIPIDLFNEVMPNVKLDYYHTRQKQQYFATNFSLPVYFDDNMCVVGVYSGKIAKNPFTILKFRTQDMIKQSYHGYLDIYWETVEYDSNGNKRVVQHKERLTATTWHDAPSFKEHVKAFYGCDAAPDLRFSREPFGVDGMSDNKLSKNINKKYKEYRKQVEKNLKDGKSIMLMANEEFEALFGAVDRDNDVQFRLLFTPLAQQNMVELMKDRDYLGDNFYMDKFGKLNVNENVSFQQLSFSTGVGNYYSFDLEEFRSNFIGFTSDFLLYVYMQLIPFLNIPMYQQTEPEKTFEDFVGGKEEIELSNFDAETLVNDDPKYEPEATKTPCITKAKYSGTKDKFNIYSYGFDTEEMLEYVSVKGGDGYYHDVPVYWIKYIKVSNATEMTI